MHPFRPFLSIQRKHMYSVDSEWKQEKTQTQITWYTTGTWKLMYIEAVKVAFTQLKKKKSRLDPIKDWLAKNLLHPSNEHEKWLALQIQWTKHPLVGVYYQNNNNNDDDDHPIDLIFFMPHLAGLEIWMVWIDG